MVRACSVSRVTESTVAVCQPSRGAEGVVPPAHSVARVPLFPPWVSVVVVAVHFPEAGRVVLPQPQPAYPFGAFPEVQVRDEQPGLARRARAPAGCRRRSRPPTPSRRSGRPPVGSWCSRRRRRPARRGRRTPPRRAARPATPGPGRVELGPPGHAVDVDPNGLGRQCLEFGPGPPGGGAGALDGERPVVQPRARGGPGRQHREIGGHVLAGRDPARGLRLLTAAVEAARDRAHTRQITPWLAGRY